jgi:hypothetical protein
MLIGFEIAGLIADAYKISETSFDWKMIWIIPSGIALLVFIVFAVFFNEKNEKIVGQNINF